MSTDNGDNDDLKRYNIDTALESLRLIDTKNIPCLEEDPPSGVSEVKFKSDCSNIPMIKFEKENQENIEK